MASKKEGIEIPRLLTNKIVRSYPVSFLSAAIVMKHALRNALNPVITATGGWFASMLAGAFFIEYIFNWKGLGRVTVDALEKSDFPLIMGSVLVIAVIFIAMSILVDVLYAMLDPRIRLN